MKNLRLILCVSLALSAACAVPAAAGYFPGAEKFMLGQSDACTASCLANSNACRTQCGDPEEQEQCIVGDCGISSCKADCQKFEDACRQRCAKVGG